MQIARLLSGFVLLSSLLLQSCQQEPLRITAEEEYIREFYKTFKNVDPDHDWNLAQKSTVTVKTSVPSSIRVLADVKGTRYLFADYKDAQGTSEIPVTLPKGVSDIIVSVNGQNFPSTLGATVDATSAKSRKVWEYEEIEGKFNVSITENRIFRTPEEVLRYREYLPEEKYNIGKVIEDFMFESKGPFLVYPAYYQTSRYQSNIIGIYHYDDNGKLITQDFFRLGDGKLMTYTTQEEPVEGSATLYGWQQDQLDVPSGADKYVDFTEEDWEFIREKCRYGEIYFVDNNFKIFSEFNHQIQEDGNVVLTGKYRSFNTVYGINSNTSIPDKAKTLCFQGIKVDIPIGQKFGMYIKLENKMGDPSWGIDPEHTYFFSQSEHNTDYLWRPNEGQEDNVLSVNQATYQNSTYWGANSSNPTPAVHAATFTREDGMIRLCFEDWYNNSSGNGFDSDFDLNDMVFYLSGEIETTRPEIIPDKEPDPYTWIIAAEDLGGSFDWDFNDLVAQVQLLSVNKDDKEYTEVTVKPLASGGYRPVYLMYTGKIYDIENATESTVDENYIVGGEFHTLFGSSHGNPINVSKGQKKQADEIVFYTPKGHTMASHVHYNGSNMGGFWVLSCKENSPLSGVSPTKGLQPIDRIPEGQGINQVGAPNSNKELTSPQIMCLEARWRWPLELKDIRNAYTTFETWVSDKDKTDWVKTFNEEHIIEEY